MELSIKELMLIKSSLEVRRAHAMDGQIDHPSGSRERVKLAELVRDVEFLHDRVSQHLERQKAARPGSSRVKEAR
jgi:hypothetical protein